MKNDDLDCDKLLEKSTHEEEKTNNKDNDDMVEIDNEFDVILNNVQNEIENLKNVKIQLNNLKNKRLRQKKVKSSDDEWVNPTNTIRKKVSLDNFNVEDENNFEKKQNGDNIVRLNGQNIDLSALTKLLNLNTNNSAQFKEVQENEKQDQLISMGNTPKKEVETKEKHIVNKKNEEKMLSNLIKFSRLGNENKKEQPKIPIKKTEKPISMSLSEIEKQISLLKNLSFKEK